MATERRRRLAAWGSALLLFAVGAAAGVAADRLLLSGRGDDAPPRGPPSAEAIVERMTRDLDLDAEQARRIRAVVDERWKALGALFERIDPEAEALRKDADARIREILRPAQRERFDRRVAEREQRRAEMRRRLGPPGPPGP